MQEYHILFHILIKNMDPAVPSCPQPWQSVFDAITAPICILDLEGRILNFNRAMETFLGPSTGSILGRSCCRLFHDTDGPIPGCPLVRLRESRRSESLNLMLGGRYRRLSADPLIDEQGNLIGAVHIVTDLFDGTAAGVLSRDPGPLKREEQRRGFYQRRLRDREAENRRLGYRLAADWIEPLAALKVTLQTLALKKQDDFSTKLLTEALETVDRAVGDSRRLLEQLRPPLLDDLGLLPALRQLTAQRAEQTGTPVHFQAGGPARRFSPEWEETCFNLVREVLGLVAGPDGTGAVSVSLAGREGFLEILIVGRGPEIEEAAVEAGLSLSEWEEEIRPFQGRLELRSLPDGGQEVRMELPWPEDAPPPSG